MRDIETDVLLIGSGLSSLTAAALLAKRGLRVAVAEQHFQPGGSCGAFRRQGRTFDQGTAMLFGFGEQGFNPHRFVMNELEEPISVIRHRHLYRLNYGGVPITFSSDMEHFFTQLASLFPNETAGIRKFYSYIADLYHNVITASPVCMAPSEIPKAEGLRMFLAHPVRHMKLFSLFSKSAGDLMRRFVSSQEVIDFFSKLTSTYCYTILDETPAILAVTMFMDNHVGGSYYPAGSSQQLPGKLEKAIERLGGRMYYRTEVGELVFSYGKPVGAVAHSPDGVVRFTAPWIVYGGTLRNLHTVLVPPPYRNQAELDWVMSLDMTYPSVVLYCIVSSHVIPPGTLPIEMMADNPHAIDEKEVTVYIFSLADRSLCGPDEHVVMAIGPSLRTWPKPDDPAYGGEAYLRAKQEEISRILGVLESHFPGFTEAVRSAELAAPSTIERYTMKEGGSVAGPKQSMGQDLLNRQHASTRWESLVCCGEATVMGTGSPAVTISGISAANLLLRRMGKQEYRWTGALPEVVQTISEQAPEPVIDVYGRVIPTANMIQGEVAMQLHESASLCQWCDPAVCSDACPVSYDIRGTLRRLECGNLLGSARNILEAPHSTGKLACLNCNAPCEDVCMRKQFDPEGVPIREILVRMVAMEEKQ